MKDYVSAGGLTNIKLSELDPENSMVWNTEKVNKLLSDFENGELDIKTLKNSPFKDNDPAWKKQKIVFEYTQDELEELKKCKADPVYFASKYAQILTDDGVVNVELRDYQIEIIDSFKKNRYNCLMASRQIGKCFSFITSVDIKFIHHSDFSQFLEFANFTENINYLDYELTTLASEIYYYMKYIRNFKLSDLDILRREICVSSYVDNTVDLGNIKLANLDKIEYLNKHLDQTNINHKIQEAYPIEFDLLIKTDTGFSPISLCNRTQPYKMVKIITDSNLSLTCADHHILFDKNMHTVLASNLTAADYIITKNGVEKIADVIELDYDESLLDFSLGDFNHRFYTNGILSHNTVMSAVFIAWYLLFHVDRNVLTVANVATTTKEVLDKIKSVLEHLPFFLKPGCVSNNVMSMKFDNGCRLIGRTTTKNTGIGFTIHLLYIDEFAHINPSYLDFFYRAIYPTISSSAISKVIITSTPNGMNKFYEIYTAALDGKNEYTPLRVDWWQVPGRDEVWKAKTIANLGSEEDFNQEYGIQFFASDKLLLPGKDLKKLYSLRTTYISPEWAQSPEHVDLLTGFTVHPNFAKFNPDDIRASNIHYIFNIDTAGGVGRDYSVINIFKLIALPIPVLLKVKDFIKNEGDIFGLVQVATFRSNNLDIHQFTNVLEYLMYTIFNPENVLLNIELDYKGDYVLEQLEKREDFWRNQVIHSKHTVSSVVWKPGLKMTEVNKSKYCERFKYLAAVNKILPNDRVTIHELGAFGKTNSNTYRSQNGNDDLAMSSILNAAFFESPNFWELVNLELEKLDIDYLNEVYSTFFGTIYKKTSIYDYESLSTLNKTPEISQVLGQSRISESTILQYQEVYNEFYGKSKS